MIKFINLAPRTVNILIGTKANTLSGITTLKDYSYTNTDFYYLNMEPYEYGVNFKTLIEDQLRNIEI